jgi:AcrR family transcriptional regulator
VDARHVGERPSRRALQAEQTRADILQAARRQFAANGYAATSLKVIAADAGVSVQTLYDSVGSKADLVRGLNDLIDAEAQIAEIIAAIPDETDPTRLLAIPARVARRIVERCGDIVRASFDAAHSEPDVAAVVAEGGRRLRVGANAIAARLHDVGAVATSEQKRAALTIAAITDLRMVLLLVDEHRLKLAAAEEWMTTTLVRVVLGRS